MPDADDSNTFKDAWYTNPKQGGAGQNCPDNQGCDHDGAQDGLVVANIVQDTLLSFDTILSFCD